MAKKTKNVAKKKAKKKVAKKKVAKKVDTIQLTEAQFQKAVENAARDAVARYKTEQTARKPIPVDISDNVQLKTRLEAMKKDQLIKFGADEFNLKIEPVLTEKVIIENLLKLDNARKSEATKDNETSLKKTISQDDPPITVKFFNLQSPEEVLNFSFAGPKGRRGPVNKTGHKKCPSYKFYPGETYTVALSVKEHLESLMFTHYKTVVDKVTGHVAGTVATMKPKYILNPVITKEQLISLQT